MFARSGRAAVVAALLLMLAACAPDDASRGHSTEIAQRPLSMAAVGDSLTSWAPPYAGDPAQSWTLTAAETVPLVGGWALPGASLERMAENVTPAPSAYFAVVMGGINDLAAGRTEEARLASLARVLATLRARHVLILATAPYDPDPAGAAHWNDRLRDYAERHGYPMIDPWVSVRSDSGEWAEGASRGDGVHPTPAAAATAGSAIATELARLYATDRS